MYMYMYNVHVLDPINKVYTNQPYIVDRLTDKKKFCMYMCM